MCKYNFTPDKKALKEMKALQSRKEELLFLSLCSESDYNLLKRDTEITLKDFQRIAYLTRHLGLPHYCLTFENRHPDLLKKMGGQIEYEVLHHSIDIKGELQKQKRWENEFLARIPDSRMKSCIRKLFRLS